MKKIFSALLLVGAVVVGILVGTSSASAVQAVPQAACSASTHLATFTTSVSADPDSGNHGDWAVDNFVRTTEISLQCDGTYKVDIFDNGTFTTLSDANSPGAGLPLPFKPIMGKFQGSDTFTVTSKTAPVLVAPANVVGGPSTSTWASRFFAGNNGVGGAWGWTYTTPCEKWIDASTGTPGDITGKVCPTKPPVPTSTVTAPPTTVVQPVPGQTKVVTVTNPGQFAAVPDTAKGVNTGDGSLS
jgi:hypothetical protein